MALQRCFCKVLKHAPVDCTRVLWKHPSSVGLRLQHNQPQHSSAGKSASKIISRERVPPSKALARRFIDQNTRSRTYPRSQASMEAESTTTWEVERGGEHTQGRFISVMVSQIEGY
eukprot:9469937-Pyramimonas_sp.AAC.3